MNKNRVIVLEGAPASGKTSLANYFRDNFCFFKVNESSGKLPINTGNQQAVFKDTIDKYILARKKDGIAVIDRGCPSLLAWDYCRMLANNIDQYKEKQIWINNVLEKNDLYEPFLYVYLHISPELSFTRRPRKPNKVDVWSSKKGVANCIYFYSKLFRQKNYNTRTLIVNGALTSKIIAGNIIRQIKNNA